MQHSFPLSTFCFLLAGGALLGQAPQTPPSLDDELQALLNTPISGASKREQRLIDSPQAVEVLTGEEIRQMGIYRLQDALKLMTSIDLLEGDNGYSVIGMRGIMQEGQPRTVQILIDGVPQYSPAGGPVDISNIPVPIDLIDKVEVVRGPSSTLYGANAVAGVVSITTKSPESGVRGQARFSRADKTTSRGAASLYTGNGPWSFMAGYQGYAMGASGHESHLLGDPSFKRLFRDGPGLGSVTANPRYGSDSAHGYQAFTRVQYKQDGTAVWGAFSQADKWYGPEGYFLYRTAERQMGLLGWRQTWTGTFSTELRAHRMEMGNHLSASPYLTVALEDPGFAGDYKWMDQTITQVELQGNWEPSKTLHIVFGLDTRKIKVGKAIFVGLSQGAEETASGGFLTADWNLTENMTLSAGARAENESLGGSRVSPRAVFVWNPTKASAFRVGYFTSTRSPQTLEQRVDLSLFSGQFYPAATNPLPPNIPVYARLLPNPDLKPEKTTNYEVGYRHSVGALTLDVTLYQMKLTELIKSVSLPPVVVPGATKPPFVPITYAARLNVPNQFQNAGDATNRGLEVAATWLVAKGYTLGANAVWLRFTKDTVQAGDPMGEDFAYAAEKKANLWLRIQEGRFHGHFAVQAVGATTAEALSTSNPYFEPRDQSIQWHANVGWELLKGLTAGLYARNGSQEFTLQGATGPERQRAFLAARREMGATVAYRF